MPWAIGLDVSTGSIKATLHPIINDPVRVIDSLLKTDSLKEVREGWEQAHADRLIRAIEVDPDQTGRHYAAMFDRWFRDWLIRHHRPIEGEDLVIDGRTYAVWMKEAPQ